MDELPFPAVAADPAGWRCGSSPRLYRPLVVRAAAVQGRAEGGRATDVVRGVCAAGRLSSRHIDPGGAVVSRAGPAPGARLGNRTTTTSVITSGGSHGREEHPRKTAAHPPAGTVCRLLTISCAAGGLSVCYLWWCFGYGSYWD